MGKKRGLKTVLLGLSLVAGIVLAQDDDVLENWAAYDESMVLQKQQSHPHPRMRFKLLSSPLGERSDLWAAFEEELAGFDEEYQRLKPLVMDARISDLQTKVAAGQLTYESLAKFYVYRIRQYENDPQRFLNAVISLNPKLMEQARVLDKRRASGEVTIDAASIFGMPILLKDNVGTAGMPTTAGAAVLRNNVTEDAFIVSQLKSAGALILGKANLSEWAYFFCSGCPLGYSYVGGQTLNPHNRLVIETGGSSSGSAVAVTANYAVAAVGSETSGSILSPASLNSVVGFKPTTGSLSRTGVVPIASSLDTAGPITRSVQDAVILFNAMAGFDQNDRAMPLLSDDLRLIHRSPEELDAVFVGLNLGVIESLSNNPDYSAAITMIANSAVEITEIQFRPPPFEGFRDFLGGEMRIDLASYLQTLAGEGVSIADIAQIVAANTAVDETLAASGTLGSSRGVTYAPYGQALFEQIVSSDLTDAEVQSLGEGLQSSARQHLNALFGQYQLDAILSLNNFHAGIAALANFPAVTIPMGLDNTGRPLGLTVITPSFSEQLLIDIAAALEGIFDAQVRPLNYAF